MAATWSRCKWSMKNLYGIEPGEVYWCGAPMSAGWSGHSYIVYAPLLHGCTTILYEGKPVGTPDAGAFWRVISEHGAVALFTAPTAFRAIKKEDPEGEASSRKYDLSKFRTLFLAGERADPDTVKWAESMLKVPVIDHWWQTETGWCIAGNPVGLGHAAGEARLADRADAGLRRATSSTRRASRSPPNKMGSIVVKLPLPPACLPTLWQQDERFKESYLAEFPGYYKTADAGFKDEDGYVFVMGRTDDIINVAGHRLSTGGMEEVLAAHPDVAECAVIGIKDELKGEVPCGFVVLKAGVNRPPAEIEKEIVALVREKIGPVAAFKLAITVPRLPKTRSGKILRGTMKKIADGDAWTMPATIDDPAILDEIGAALKEQGRGAVAKKRSRFRRGRLVPASCSDGYFQLTIRLAWHSRVMLNERFASPFSGQQNFSSNRQRTTWRAVIPDICGSSSGGGNGSTCRRRHSRARCRGHVEHANQAFIERGELCVSVRGAHSPYFCPPGQAKKPGLGSAHRC